MENPLQGREKRQRESILIARNIPENVDGPVSLAASLKACAEQMDWHKGRRIHLEIIRRGLLQKNTFLGNTLVNMYAKCGILAIAQEVFDELPIHNVVSWNVLLAGYSQHGHGQACLNCFRRMQIEGLSPTAISLLCVLKACANTQALEKGQELHATMEEFLEKDIKVANAMVDMYTKCGALTKAQEVFDKLPARDAVTWNAIIAGLAQHGHAEQALTHFEQMQLQGFSPDAITSVCMLKACGSMGALNKGQEIHAMIVRDGLLEKDVVVGTALVDMYGKCNLLTEALEVFDKLPERSLVSWNALLAGYAEHGYGEEALRCFEQMDFEGLSPNMVTFICVLKACGSIGASEKGQEIHDEITRGGFLKEDTAVGNALIDMYVKCGLLEKAKIVLTTLAVQDVISWSTLLAGYAQHERNEEVLDCYKQMQNGGVFPNTVTFVCVLKACGSIGNIAALHKGHGIHAKIIRKGMLEKDSVVGTALVDMYAGCGMLAEAQIVFDKLPFWDLVSWNALIARYSQHLQNEEALNCFEQMQFEGFTANVVTFVCTLKACGSMGAAQKGHRIHAEISRIGLLEEELVLGTALVDLYANCGMLIEAHEVFKKLPVQNVVTWNALLAGYSLIGRDDITFNLFERMIADNKVPNSVTFTVVLNTCSHTGSLDVGQMFFANLNAAFGIIPTLEHHSCMVDLFGRIGDVDKALAVIKEMPFFANLTVWHTLLGACQRWGNMGLGKLAFEHSACLNETDAAAYVSMSNIYINSGWHERLEYDASEKA